jgi:streptogrisin C
MRGRLLAVLPAGLLAAVVCIALAPPVYATGPGIDEDEVAGFARQRDIPADQARQRLAWQAAAPDLAEALATSLRSRSAGVWVDVNDRDRIKVGIVGGLDSTILAAVRRAAEDVGLAAGGYDVLGVAHTLTALEADNQWLGGEIARVNQGAAATLVTSIRTDRNAVELLTPREGTLTAEQAALTATAVQRLGDKLITGRYDGQLEARSCGSAYCGAPLRGGVRITPDIVNNNSGCTAGFVAQSKVDEKQYILTAGHCGSAYNTVDWVSQTYDGTGYEYEIGPVWHWHWSGQGDMAIIRVDNPLLWNPKPWVNVTDGPDTTKNETYTIGSDKTSVIGMRICTTGSYYGHSDCGFVTHLGMTGTYGGMTVHNLGRASFCGTSGDSGSPMYAQHVAFGLQVAGFSECDSVYQGIKAAETKLNVNVLHS